MNTWAGQKENDGSDKMWSLQPTADIGGYAKVCSNQGRVVKKEQTAAEDAKILHFDVSWYKCHLIF